MDRNRETVGLSKADRIRLELEHEIITGKRANGERLDSEMQLMARFSVSRNTVRKSLEKLARRGLIAKRSGVGSFVTYRGDRFDDTPGWSRKLGADAERMETRITSLGRGSCSRTRRFLTRAELALPAHADDYLRIDRIRRDRVFGTGLSIERSRLPWRREFQHVLDNGLVDDSVHATLESLPMTIASGREWVCVSSTLSERDAELLRRETCEPMLHLQRITCDGRGDLIEFTDSLLDPERFTLQLNF